MAKSFRREFPEDIKNSEIINTIDEYVRHEKDRNILKDYWFGDHTFETLAEKYNVSTTTIKKTIYNIGDKILLKF